MDYRDITRFLGTNPPRKPWWELGPEAWPDPGYDDHDQEGEVEQFLGPEPPLPPSAPPVAPPPRGLLDRVADRMNDLGYGGGEEARRVALRRALGAFGSRLAAGAMKEGLGGLAPAVGEGFGAYEGGLAEQRKRRDIEGEISRQAEGERVQQQYMDALTEQMQGNAGEKARSLREAIETRKALIDERRAYLDTLDPEKRERLAPLIGADPDQWNRYVYETGAPPKPKEPDRRSVGGDVVEIGDDGKVTVLYRSPKEPKEPREPGAPTTRDFPDGTERQWNPGTKTWDVIARKPAGSGKAFDQRGEATRIYTDALKDKSHSAYRSKAGPDGADIPDVKATWKAAWEAAGAAAPPPVNSTNDTRNDAPEANHARNKALAALGRGASEQAVLAELRKIGSLNGFTPEQILQSAKRMRPQRVAASGDPTDISGIVALGESLNLGDAVRAIDRRGDGRSPNLEDRRGENLAIPQQIEAVERVLGPLTDDGRAWATRMLRLGLGPGAVIERLKASRKDWRP